MRKIIGLIAIVGSGIFLLLTTVLFAGPQSDFEKGVTAHDRGDVVTAIGLLQLAADQGHVGAMVRLGYLLDKSEQNKAAFRMYSRAAEAGRNDAALALGVMYANGEGVRKNPQKALEWISRAAEAGHGPAIITFALVYLRGDLGVSPDRDKAIRWLKKGVAGGYEPARQELERLRTAKKVRAGK